MIVAVNNVHTSINDYQNYCNSFIIKLIKTTIQLRMKTIEFEWI
jgi:hypothetical protein